MFPSRLLLPCLPILLLFSCTDPAPKAPAPSSEETIQPEDLVKLDLLPTASHLVANQPATIAARFAIAEGWHIYWTNPGDSGIRTTLALTAPPDFAIGEVRFPGPERFLAAGDIVSYGYHDETAFFATVTPPDGARGQAEIVASASWLACRDACVRGKSEARLELPVADNPNEVRPTNEAAVRPHLARLPTPLGDQPGASASWTDEESPVLHVRIAGAQSIELFPARHEALELTAQERAADNAAALLEAHFRWRAGASRTLPSNPGVLRVARGTESTYHEITIDGGAP